jgi:hypothetical protein
MSCVPSGRAHGTPPSRVLLSPPLRSGCRPGERRLSFRARHWRRDNGWGTRRPEGLPPGGRRSHDGAAGGTRAGNDALVGAAASGSRGSRDPHRADGEARGACVRAPGREPHAEGLRGAPAVARRRARAGTGKGSGTAGSRSLLRGLGRSRSTAPRDREGRVGGSVNSLPPALLEPMAIAGRLTAGATTGAD